MSAELAERQRAAWIELSTRGLHHSLMPTLIYPDFGDLFNGAATRIGPHNIGTLICPWDAARGKDLWAKSMSGDIDATGSLFILTPNCARGLLVQIAFRNDMPVPTFRELLQCAWDHDHDLLTHLPKRVPYGSIPKTTLRTMFEHAAFDVTGLPDVVRLYRGVRLYSAPQAAAGIAWTRRRELAAWFAIDFHKNDEPPLVLTADVPRSKILAHINSREEDECVCFGVRGARIDGMAEIPLRDYFIPAREAEASWTEAAANETEARGRGYAAMKT